MKKTLKLFSLFILLTISFIYTDKVFSAARKNDVIMKEVIKYKRKNDVDTIESKINGDEIILGLSGIDISTKKSYKNMKKNNKFDPSKIIYDNKLPKISISNTYKYYIKNGNNNNNEVAIILKINDNDNIEKILSYCAKNNIIINYFVDGKWLEDNVSQGFSIVNLGNELYNLGYNGSYDKRYITITNNMIESISMKKSNYCLVDKKDKNILNLCKKKKMHTIVTSINNPNVIEVKNNLSKGTILSFDLDDLDIDTFSVIVKIIVSKGYNIAKLSSVISESRKY